MAADREAQLLRLAEAVGDHEPVSWEEQRAAADELGPVVTGLQQLHALAGAFAAVHSADDRQDRPQVLGRWAHLELISKIGEGAFGEVYRARDPYLDREVALKLRRAGPGSAGASARRLLEEARRLAMIRHGNVVAVHGVDLADGRVGIWTELVDGQTLEQRLEQDGPFGPQEAIAIGLDLCRALAAVHAAGLVHGDVKTANVLREKGGRIVLSDLGSATVDGAPAVTGSPATLAPEILEGGPSSRAADIYSLGVLLFRLLTGRYHFDPGSTATQLPTDRSSRRSRLRDLRPDLPLNLVQVVERALDPDPEKRFASAGAFEQALAGLGADSPAATSRRNPAQKKLRILVIGSMAAGMVIVGGLALLLHTPTPTPEDRPLQAARTPGEAPVAGAPSSRTESEIGTAGEIPPGADQVAAIPSPLAVTATMFRSRESGEEALSDGDRVQPGDRLFLEFEAAEPVYAWVVNEDLEGNLFVLFPIAGLDLDNPLAGDTLHRLPGRLAGSPQQWQVTSAGGRETFVIIAARTGLPEVERELASLVAANPSVGGPQRGVGSLLPAPAAGRGRLDGLARSLAARRDRDGSVWLARLELVNP